MKNPNKIKSPPSLKEIATQALKNAIIFKKLVPGEFYKTEIIAQDFGISKTPVREALLELEAKGFISFLPRKGFQINELDEKSIKDLFAFRVMVEISIIDIITPAITVQQIDALKDNEIKAKQCLASGDKVSFQHYQSRFHSLLAEFTDNRYLIDTMSYIRDHVDWALLKKKSRLTKPIIEHEQLIEKLIQKNSEATKCLMTKHIVRNLTNLIY